MAGHCPPVKSCARAQSTAGKTRALRGELTWGVAGPPFTSPIELLGFIQESCGSDGVSYLGVSKSHLDVVLGR